MRSPVTIGGPGPNGVDSMVSSILPSGMEIEFGGVEWANREGGVVELSLDAAGTVISIGMLGWSMVTISEE